LLVMNLMLLMQRLHVIVLPKVTSWRSRAHLIHEIRSLTLD